MFTHKIRLRLCALCCVLLLCFCACGKIGGSSELSSSTISEPLHSRPYYTEIEGSGKDRWLLLFYINAAEAEEYALASYALSQLLGASLSDRITIVVQTYGTQSWQGEFMDGLSDRILITADGIRTASYSGSAEPGSAQMLADFASDCLREFPDANRKALFFWGRNELYAGDIAYALGDARLDFIAFDTQPQTALEDAFLLQDAADYLIASAGTYAVSWNFSHLLEALDKNTSYLSKDIARLLAEGVLSDDIFSATGTRPALYCADLTRIDQVCSRISALLAEAEAAIAEGKFSGVALARAAAAQDDCRVSAQTFARSLNLPASAEACEALAGCLAYTSAEDISLSLYLPISAGADEDFPEVLARYVADGLDYTTFLPAYLTAAACADGTGSDAPWFQGSLAAGYLQDSSDFAFPAEKVALTLQDGRFLFLLDAADAGKIDSLRLLTFADTGEHLLLLGNAPIFQQDAQGNFIAAEGQDTWLCINGQPVCSYGYTGADDAEHFLVPCQRGQTPVTLLLSDGKVTTSLVSMGVFTRTQQIGVGDILSFSYPMYSYEGEYLGESSYGYKIAVSGDLRVSDEAVDIGDLLICCTLKDISGHTYRSQMINLRTALMDS